MFILRGEDNLIRGKKNDGQIEYSSVEYCTRYPNGYTYTGRSSTWLEIQGACTSGLSLFYPTHITNDLKNMNPNPYFSKGYTKKGKVVHKISQGMQPF